MTQPESIEPIGRIVGGFGLRGQLKIEPLTDFFERFAKGESVRLRGEWVEIEASTVHKGRPLIKLKGFDTLTQAETLKWETIEGDTSKVPELDEDEFFTEDLIGLEVFLEDGTSIGVINDILTTAAHDILVIGEIMIPAIKEFVVDIDLDEEKVVVRVIEGMLGDAESDQD